MQGVERNHKPILPNFYFDACGSFFPVKSFELGRCYIYQK